MPKAGIGPLILAEHHNRRHPIPISIKKNKKQKNPQNPVAISANGGATDYDPGYAEFSVLLTSRILI